MAREIVERNPEFNTVTLAKHLGVSDETIRAYVGDILATRREERALKAWRLHRLGWNQSEVASMFEVTQKTISNDLEKIQEIGKGIKIKLAEGFTAEQLAERFSLPQIAAYAIAFDGQKDVDRLGENALGINVRPYDVWNFPSCHDLMGNEHPGRIPGELAVHVLYFFTEQGDVVLDPMAGSGTMLDACLLMGRKCFGYDIDDRHERADAFQK